MSNDRVHALIPAAGRGDRMAGEIPKQYLELAGKAVLTHVVDALIGHPGIEGVTVALASDDRWFDGLGFGPFGAPERVVGGSTRAQSVFNGLAQIAERHDPDWVLVHDAARPLLPPPCLHRLLDEGLGSPDGAILAMPVADTLKQDDGSRHIAGTVERGGLWAAQTPQLFPLKALIGAMREAFESSLTLTDEAAAMEAAGASPLLVMGSPVNFKITWPGDLEIAAALLAARVVAE